MTHVDQAAPAHGAAARRDLRYCLSRPAQPSSQRAACPSEARSSLGDGGSAGQEPHPLTGTQRVDSLYLLTSADVSGRRARTSGRRVGD